MDIYYVSSSGRDFNHSPLKLSSTRKYCEGDKEKPLSFLWTHERTIKGTRDLYVRLHSRTSDCILILCTAREKSTSKPQRLLLEGKSPRSSPSEDSPVLSNSRFLSDASVSSSMIPRFRSWDSSLALGCSLLSSK